MTGNVLLTGGFGTLGGRMASALFKNSGWKVRLASRVRHQPPPWCPNAEVFSVDFNNPKSIREMLDGMTHVIHLASLNDYECKADATAAQLVNVEYTTRIVEEAIRRINNRFVYLSTIQVYGNNLSGIINESTITGPTDAYSSTHLQAEEVVKQAHQTGRLEGIRLRCANGFGVPMTPDAKIWQIIANDLCRQAIENKSLTLKSDGLQYRNFIPMTDICIAIEHVLQMDSTKVADGLFNLGGAQSLQIIEMAERIANRCVHTLGFRPPLRLPTTPAGDSPPELNYRFDKLLATGIALASNIDREIDDLLRQCQNWFQFKD